MEGEVAKQSWPPHPCLLRPFLHANLPPNSIPSNSLGKKETKQNQAIILLER